MLARKPPRPNLYAEEIGRVIKMNQEERIKLLEEFDRFCKTYAKGIPYCIEQVFDRDKEEIRQGIQKLYHDQQGEADDKSNNI